MRYMITNKISGCTLGIYDGETAMEAYEALCKDAGYDDPKDVVEFGSMDELDFQPIQ